MSSSWTLRRGRFSAGAFRGATPFGAPARFAGGATFRFAAAFAAALGGALGAGLELRRAVAFRATAFLAGAFTAFFARRAAGLALRFTGLALRFASLALRFAGLALRFAGLALRFGAAFLAAFRAAGPELRRVACFPLAFAAFRFAIARSFHLIRFLTVADK